MDNLSDQISELVDRFVEGVTTVARKAALDAMASALGTAPALRGGGALSSRGRGGSPGPTRALRGGSRKPGAKRDPQELARLVDQLRDHVATNPGQGIEQIKKALGYKTSELSLPMRKLIADGLVRSEGQKRATKYFPGSGRKRKK